MEKLDLKKAHKALYASPKGKIVEVDVPDLWLLSVDGKGDPNLSPLFQQAVEALYSVSYTLKFMARKEGADWGVMPLEGLWWAEDPRAFETGDKEQWLWTLMILQPAWVTGERLDLAREALTKKKKNLPASPGLRLSTLPAHRAVQALHVGPYAGERELIGRMHAYMEEKGLHFAGKHQEVYLSDPRRTSPEKLRTLLRQPVS